MNQNPAQERAERFRQLWPQLFSNEFWQAKAFFAKAVKQHVAGDPLWLLQHHLTNGETPLEALFYMIITEGKDIPGADKSLLKGIDELLVRIRDPMANVRENLTSIFSEEHARAEADNYLKMLEAWRDKVRDEIKAAVEAYKPPENPVNR